MRAAHVIELFSVPGKCKLGTDLGKVAFGLGLGKTFENRVDIGGFRFRFLDLRGKHNTRGFGLIVLLIVALGVLRRRIAAIELYFDSRHSFIKIIDERRFFHPFFQGVNIGRDQVAVQLPAFRLLALFEGSKLQFGLFGNALGRIGKQAQNILSAAFDAFGTVAFGIKRIEKRMNAVKRLDHARRAVLSDLAERKIKHFPVFIGNQTRRKTLFAHSAVQRMIVKPQRIGVAFVNRRTGRFGGTENDFTRRKRRKSGIARNEIFVGGRRHAGGQGRPPAAHESFLRSRRAH